MCVTMFMPIIFVRNFIDVHNLCIIYIYIIYIIITRLLIIILLLSTCTSQTSVNRQWRYRIYSELENNNFNFLHYNL